MEQQKARHFAEQWAQAWNAHDLGALLAHFSDDVVFTSPVAAQLLKDCDGVVRGKEALRNYWSEGLRAVPDLHFEVESLYVGVHTIVINYRNHWGNLVNEVLHFDGDVVVEGHGTYLSADPLTASGSSPT